MRNKYILWVLLFFYLLNLKIEVLGKTRRLLNVREKRTFETLYGKYQSNLIREQSKTAIGFYIDNGVENPAFLRDVITKRERDNLFHLFTHGRPGQLLIEGKWRDAKQIGSWLSSQLNGRKHLNIYGCNFGYGAEGRAAVAYLKNKLGVTVSASDDITGKDGDWELEVGEQGQETLRIAYEKNLQCTDNNRFANNCDFDGDGVINQSDLDDDNDGILDKVEMKCTSNFYLMHKEVTRLDSTTSLTASSLNRYTISTSGRLLADGTTFGTSLLKHYPFASPGNDESANVRGGVATLRASGTADRSNPATARYKFTSPVHNLEIQINHITDDGGTGSHEEARLTGYSNGQEVIPRATFVGADVLEASSRWYRSITKIVTSATMVTYTFDKPVDEIVLEEHASGRSTTTINGVVISFLSGCDPQDTDADGVPNHLDLDSDGDGCTDATEAGVADAFSSTITTGTVVNKSGSSTKENARVMTSNGGDNKGGANGFHDILEKGSTGTGEYVDTYTYNLANTSGSDNDLDGIVNNCDPDPSNPCVHTYITPEEYCEAIKNGATGLGAADCDGDGVTSKNECTPPVGRTSTNPKSPCKFNAADITLPVDRGAQINCACADLTKMAANCDYDGDGKKNSDDLDDDNDGILDTTETVCESSSTYDYGLSSCPANPTGALAITSHCTGWHSDFPTTKYDFDFLGVVSGRPRFDLQGSVEPIYGRVAKDLPTCNTGSTYTYSFVAESNTVAWGFYPIVVKGVSYNGFLRAVDGATGKVLAELKLPTGNKGGTYSIDFTARSSTTKITIGYDTIGSTEHSSTLNTTIGGRKSHHAIIIRDGSFGLKGAAENSLCCYKNPDIDHDGIPNHFDLDTDGDGCADVIEGAGPFDSGDVVTSTLPGGNSGAEYTGKSKNSVKDDLGNVVDTNGVPTMANGGQGLGESQVSGSDADADGIPAQCDPSDTDPCQNTYTTKKAFCDAITAGATGLGSADCDKDGETNTKECTGDTDPKDPCKNSYTTPMQVCAAITAGADSLGKVDCDGDGVINRIECTPPGGRGKTDPRNSCDFNTADITLPVDHAAQINCACADPKKMTANCDYDGDGKKNRDDLDDDNDGILDTIECVSLVNSLSIQEGFEDYVGCPDYSVGPTIENAKGWSTEVVQGGQLMVYDPGTCVSNAPSTIASGWSISTHLTGGSEGKNWGGYHTREDGQFDLEGKVLKAGLTYSLKIDAGYVVANSVHLSSGFMIITGIPTANADYSVDKTYKIAEFTVDDRLLSTDQTWEEHTITFTPKVDFNRIIFTNRGNGGSSYIYFDNLRIDHSADISLCDLDKDGIPNHFDLDSDGDGCADAIEGAGAFDSRNVLASTLPGGNTGTDYIGTSPKSVKENLGDVVDANGVPTIANGGQGLGDSQVSGPDADKDGIPASCDPNDTDPCQNTYTTSQELCKAITAGATGLGSADCDMDGETNTKECTGGTDPLLPCSNSWNTKEKFCAAIILGATGLIDIDCDGDGVINSKECTDGTDPLDPCKYLQASVTLPRSMRWDTLDCDKDKVPNRTDPDPKDPCKNGYTTAMQVCAAITAGADSLGKVDCDGDGVINSKECTDRTDPLDPCKYLQASVTLPRSAAWDTLDCDKDKVPNKTDPDPKDPCKNGYTTPMQVCAAITAGADSLGKVDCDGDGVINSKECTSRTNPLDPCSSNRADTTKPVTANLSNCNRCANFTTGTAMCTAAASDTTFGKLDCDGDGVINRKECTDRTDPLDPCKYLQASVTLSRSAAWDTLDCDKDKVPNKTDPDPKDPCKNGYTTPMQVCAAITAGADSLGKVDCDGDGVINRKECTDRTDPLDPCKYLQASVTLSRSAAWDTLDCDKDKVPNKTDPDPKDPCKNGYTTPMQVCAAITAGADSLGKVDCDGDGVINSKECTSRTNPLDPCSSNRADTTKPVTANLNNCNRCANFTTGTAMCTAAASDTTFGKLDCDGDGVINRKECTDRTDPLDPCKYLQASVTLPRSAAWDTLDCDKDKVPNRTDPDPKDPCKNGYTTPMQVCAAITAGADSLGKVDCDGDGVINRTECKPPNNGTPTDPLIPCSHNIPDRTLTLNADLSGCCPTISNDPLVNTHPTVCGASNGTIRLCGLAVNTSGYTISYVLNAGAETLVAGRRSDTLGCLVVSNIQAGTYTKIFVKSARCMGSNQLSATLSDPDSPSIGMGAKTDPSLCGASDGSFTITGLAQSIRYKLSYNKDGVPQTPFSFTSTSTSFVLLGLTEGEYTGISVTSNGCKSNEVVTRLSDPTMANITASSTSPTGCKVSDATMTITGLVAGTKYTFIYSKDGIGQQVFTLTATSSSYIFKGLNAGDYRVKVRSGNCNSNEAHHIIADPGSAVIAVAGVNPTLCDATDGSYTITGLTQGLTYTLNFVKDEIQQGATNFTASSTSHKISGLSAGVYSGINVTQGGCKSNTVQVNLTDPEGTQINAISYAPTSCTTNDGRIQVVGLIPGVNYILKYSKNGVTQTDIPLTATGTSFELKTLVSAKYSNIRVDQASCISNSVNVDFPCDPCLIAFTSDTSLCRAASLDSAGLAFCDYDGDGVTNKNECTPPGGGTTTRPLDPCDFNRANITKPVTALPGKCGAILKIKLMLQGALLGNATGIMRDDLRKNKVIPSKEPYTALGGRFKHVGGGGKETLDTTALANRGNNSVVDWVFVELRDSSNSSKALQTVSALVQRDGDVVSANDGTSPLTFSGRVGQKHFVAVRHRNHLGAMTNSPITLTSAGTVVDFTTMSSANAFHSPISTPNYDGFEQTSILGINALWAGNVNNDRKVKNSGVSNDRIPIFVLMNNATLNPGGALNTDKVFPVYMQEDVNMDAKVKYNGTGNDPSYIFTNVVSRYKLNSAANANYDLFVEQLP